MKNSSNPSEIFKVLGNSFPMSNLRNIRQRIRSVKGIAQITKAMQMVAASKMKKAQLEAKNGRNYLSKLKRVLSLALSQKIHKISPTFLEKKKVSEGKSLVFVVSTERGLCGSLNANLLRKALSFEKEQRVFSILGTKITSSLKKASSVDTEWKMEPDIPEQARKIAKSIINSYLDGIYNRVEIVYAHFFTILKQEPLFLPLLPLEANSLREESENSDSDTFLFEPSFDEVLENLLPLYIEASIRQTILESQASEHSSRMIAMKSATDNAKELIDDLSLEYNRLRQSAITQELLEISSAMIAIEEK